MSITFRANSPQSTSNASIGVDLVEYARASALWRSAGSRLRRILSKKEWESVCRSRRPERKLAAILAGKEAVFKASGRAWLGPDGFRSVRIPRGRVAFKRAARYVVATCRP